MKKKGWGKLLIEYGDHHIIAITPSPRKLEKDILDSLRQGGD